MMNGNKFMMIPESVLHDTNLTPNAKIMYVYIFSCAGNGGYCEFTNAYFGELLGLSTSRSSKLLHELENNGYVKVVIERDDRKCVISRKIYPILKEIK